MNLTWMRTVLPLSAVLAISALAVPSAAADSASGAVEAADIICVTTPNLPSGGPTVIPGQSVCVPVP